LSRPIRNGPLPAFAAFAFLESAAGRRGTSHHGSQPSMESPMSSMPTAAITRITALTAWLMNSTEPIPPTIPPITV